MSIRTTALCAALLICSACATPSYRPSLTPLALSACSAEATAPCEPAEADPANATLADAEEVDAINRARWLRCVQRHAEAVRCIRAVVAGEGATGEGEP